MSELKERENLIVPYRVIDISTIKVPRYDGKQLSYGQYSDLPKNCLLSSVKFSTKTSII